MNTGEWTDGVLALFEGKSVILSNKFIALAVREAAKSSENESYNGYYYIWFRSSKKVLERVYERKKKLFLNLAGMAFVNGLYSMA